MSQRLRVGVVGLGARWRRHYRPALAALADRFAVAAVTDPSPRRAAAAARRLGCAAAPGVVALLDQRLDALLLCGRPWYRLWPLEPACRVGTPVYCGPSLAHDAGRADALVRQARAAGLPVMAELLPRLAPATDRLRRLLPRLGRLTAVVATAERPRRAAGADAARAAGLALLDWCAAVLGRPPAAAHGVAAPADGHAAWRLDFADAVGQLVTWPGPGRRGGARLRVVGERGAAEAVLPGRVRWRLGGRRYAAAASAAPPVRRALERFHAALSAGHAPEPNLDDAYQALALLRAAGA